MLLHLVLPGENDVEGESVPRVLYAENEEQEENLSEAFIKRLSSALSAAMKLTPPRMTIELPGKT